MNLKENVGWLGRFFPEIGLFSLLWFLCRVIPKPSRASYPCMRVATPLASSFILWIIGIGSAGVLLRTTHNAFRNSKAVLGILLSVSAIVMAIIVFAGVDLLPVAANPNETLPDPINDPLGVPQGYNPGRVVWVHDPDATDWVGPESGESCWSASHIDQTVVDSMMSRTVQWLSGEKADANAWDALFRHFNRQRGKGDRGYQPGERIAIKINLVTSSCGTAPNEETRIKTSYLDKAGDTTPQMTLSLLRQLIDVVGVNQYDISVGDPGSFFTDPWFVPMASEFPNVNYLDHYPYTGRTQVQYSSTPLYWSATDAIDKLTDYLPVSFSEADYLINFAVLKGHSSGISVCAKNHYGSLIRNPVGIEWGVQKNFYNLHDSLPNSQWSPGRGHYRAQVDLMGHWELGAKTLLYLIDGLYAGYYWEGTPLKWNMPPFSGDWPSSLFASQDPVAIDSVAYDFLLAEWPHVVKDGIGGIDSLEDGAQDYLHEAALAWDPPSETFYDPENDGVSMGSLGVHEHWNNSDDKQYSRNLGSGEGIELISSESSMFICEGDLNEDDDIDGSDLAELSNNINLLDLGGFASNFGKVECTIGNTEFSVDPIQKYRRDSMNY